MQSRHLCPSEPTRQRTEKLKIKDIFRSDLLTLFVGDVVRYNLQLVSCPHAWLWILRCIFHPWSGFLFTHLNDSHGPKIQTTFEMHRDKKDAPPFCMSQGRFYFATQSRCVLPSHFSCTRLLNRRRWMYEVTELFVEALFRSEGIV